MHESSETSASFANQQTKLREPSLPHRQSLVYITVIWPFQPGSEVFFAPELMQLRNAEIELRVLPRDVPRSRRIVDAPEDLSQCVHGEPPFSLQVLWWAWLESMHNPRALLGTLSIIFSSINLNLIRNLAVLPKALWLARFARKANVTHLHAQWGGTTATMAMVASCLTGIPWSVTYHRNDLERGNLLEFKLRHASFVRFISEAGLAIAREKTGVLHNQHLHVLHLGIEVPPTLDSNHPNRPIPVLCCAGSLIPRKGHRVLLDALADLKSRNHDFRLRIVGDGVLRSALESKCRELGLSDRVDFLGSVTRAELISTYAKNEIDVFVLASFDEGIPVSAMEACSYGIPCIVTDVGGVKELLRDGAGILVPPGDPVALANAIESLLLSSELREKLGTEARTRIERSFDARKTTAAFLELVSSATNRSTSYGLSRLHENSSY